MITLVESPVVFNEENHTYFLGDMQLQGITGMIGRQLFPDKYKDIPDFVLKKAALKGSHIHEQCQFADTTGFEPESIEAENYLRERMDAGYNALANEYTVSDNEHFATKVDCVWEKNGEIALVDIKTTCNLDREYLSWQLSTNAVFFEMQNPLLRVKRLFGIWLRGNKSELVPIERKTDKEIWRLLECDIKGEQYVSSSLARMNENRLVPEGLVNTIIGIEEEIKFLAELQNEYKEKLKTAMREHGVKSWDTGRLRVSYTPASSANSFDTKRFQSEHPELYSKYLKRSVKTDSIRLTIKEENK